VLLTNHLKLAAATVAEVYRERWQIEQFFRALKQSLRIKTFAGTSANAVLVQIWTARIAMLLVRWLRMRSTFGWSLSNLAATAVCLQGLDDVAQSPFGIPAGAVCG